MGAVAVKAHPAHQPAHRSEVGKVTTFPNSNVEKPYSKFQCGKTIFQVI
jgi:hypothetical protein